MFLQFAIISVSFASTIPLSTDHDGSDIPVVAVRTGSHPSTIHKIYVGSNVITHISDGIPVDARKDVMRSFLTPSSFEGSNVTLVMEAREALIGPDSTSIGAWLAIGPTSDLTFHFGSVAFVRESAQPRLVLGLSDGDFLANHCDDPQSAVRVPISQIPLTTMDGGPAHKIGAQGSLEVGGEETFGFFEFSPIETILEMGILKFMQFFASIIQRGLARPNPDRTISMTTCTPAIMAELPNIVLNFDDVVDPSQDAPVGNPLVITPTDYVVPNSDGSCRMRISIYNEFVSNEGSRRFIKLNPLVIPRMIVRSTNDDMILCKSS